MTSANQSCCLCWSWDTSLPARWQICMVFRPTFVSVSFLLMHVNFCQTFALQPFFSCGNKGQKSDFYLTSASCKDPACTSSILLVSMAETSGVRSALIANPMSSCCYSMFPGFPASVSVKQRYRLLGNSLNVHVVSESLNCLFQSPTWYKRRQCWS